jgi:hypothetical protein
MDAGGVAAWERLVDLASAAGVGGGRGGGEAEAAGAAAASVLARAVVTAGQV